MIIQGQVSALSNVSATDGVNSTVLQGKASELVVAELHGKYFTQAYRGMLFYGTTTNAGVAIPADNATAQTFAVWNPAGSGKLLVPIHLMLGIVTLGTRVASSIQFNFLTGCGSNIATGAPITAWTDTAPLSTIIGGGGISSMKFSLSATTSAATKYYQLGLFHDLAAGGSPPRFFVDFDGTLIIPQGVCACLQSADAATGSTYAATMVWAEVPV